MSKSPLTINIKATVDRRITGVPMAETALPGNNPYIVQHIKIMEVVNSVRIGHDAKFVEKYGNHDEVWLSPEQFMLLMKWGEENRAELEKGSFTLGENDV